MTTITNAIKPTMLISSPIPTPTPTPTPSIRFAARFPTTFLPIRTKPLFSSSNPLSVTVKCSNCLNLPNGSSDSEFELLAERLAAAVEEIFANDSEEIRKFVSLGKPKFKKEMLQGRLREAIGTDPEKRDIVEFMIMKQAILGRPYILKTLPELQQRYGGNWTPEQLERFKFKFLHAVWFGVYFS